jgi:hypothetical protein
VGFLLGTLFMREKQPLRRFTLNPWMAISLIAVGGVLAMTAPRLLDLVGRLVDPQPSRIIIVAPAASELV